MMTKPEPARFPLWLRKGVIPALIGGAVGLSASYALLEVIDSNSVGGLTTSNTLAALVGALYLVVALGVFIGTMNPKTGALFLNVEDADELREQKQMLAYSGGGTAMLGLALLALALAAPDGPVPPKLALAVGAGGLVIGTFLSVLVYRHCDELMMAVSLEASAISFGLVFAVVGIWGMLAHLGFADAPQPLDFLTLFYVLMLLASFIAGGRRGMLKIK